MTAKDREEIYNDKRFYVITWEHGKIYTKKSLIEKRIKQLEKLFKGVEWHCRPCSYTEFLMHYVAVKHRQLRSHIEWRCKRWNESIYFDEYGHIKFKEKDEL